MTSGVSSKRSVTDGRLFGDPSGIGCIGQPSLALCAREINVSEGYEQNGLRWVCRNT